MTYRDITEDAARPAKTAGAAGQRPWVWALAFAGAMAGIAFLEHRGILGGWRSLPFMAMAALLLLPMLKAANNRAAASGNLSPATRRYNRRGLAWSLGYVLCLGLAITIKNYAHPQGPLLWAIALLPSLPILYFVWSLVQYMREEEDEYLRHRQSLAALIGLGLVLVAGTVWGFFETFGVAPHIDAWWVVPIWALGLGIGQIVMARSERRDVAP